ncbi:hypothetical protein LXA43DRAFT_1096261 [Ganoderma leucocontextum]|nr:hypothetical protein LXA43DRAFT_1096261 [Ganoderma leucocontextum]
MPESANPSPCQHTILTPRPVSPTHPFADWTLRTRLEPADLSNALRRRFLRTDAYWGRAVGGDVSRDLVPELRAIRTTRVYVWHVDGLWIVGEIFSRYERPPSVSPPWAEGLRLACTLLAGRPIDDGDDAASHVLPHERVMHVVGGTYWGTTCPLHAADLVTAIRSIREKLAAGSADVPFAKVISSNVGLARPASSHVP